MRFLIAVVVGVVCLGSSVQAAITYAYVTDVTGTGTSASTSGSYGSSSTPTITVSIYLTETLTNGSQSIIGPGGSEAGLFQAGMAINLTGGNAVIASVSLNTNPIAGTSNGIGAANSPGFGSSNAYSGSNVAANGSSAAILDSTTFSPPAYPQAVTISNVGGTIVNEIYLGSVTIQEGTEASEFTVTSFNNSSNAYAQGIGDSTGTASPDVLSLDQSGTTPGGAAYTGTEATLSSFSVAAVPEPSSVILTGLVFAGFGYGAYRRQARNAAGAA